MTDRDKLKDEIEGIHQYFSGQVIKLGKALDDDLDVYGKEVLRIEDSCNDRLRDLHEEMGRT
eukprot:10640633-Karenia_brevis.AAC.1